MERPAPRSEAPATFEKLPRGKAGAPPGRRRNQSEKAFGADDHRRIRWLLAGLLLLVLTIGATLIIAGLR